MVIISMHITLKFLCIFRERVQNTTRSRLEEINIGGLQPDKVYNFRVVAYSRLGPGLSSANLTVKTQSEEYLPSAPQHFEAHPISSRGIRCNWVAPETSNGKILRYRVYYMEVGNKSRLNGFEFFFLLKTLLIIRLEMLSLLFKIDCIIFISNIIFVLDCIFHRV